MGATARIAISLPEPLLQRVDELASKLNETRSAFIRRSLERTIEEYDFEETVRRAREIYAEIDEEERKLGEAFLSIAVETLPERDWEGQS